MRKLLGLSLIAAISLMGCVTPTSPDFNSMSLRAPQKVKAFSYEGKRKGVEKLRKIRFAKWDTNRDWILTRTEVTDNNLFLPGVVEGFHTYDVNGDNRITLKEFLKDEVIHWWMTQYQPILDDEFFILDDNRDGKLSGAELKQSQQLFQRWPHLNGGDLDQDGVVTFSEFEDAYMDVYRYLR